MNFKGQGALEYLLIISAAVIIAVVVIVVMMNIGEESTGAVKDTDIGGTFSGLDLIRCQKGLIDEITFENITTVEAFFPEGVPDVLTNIVGYGPNYKFCGYDNTATKLCKLKLNNNNSVNKSYDKTGPNGAYIINNGIWQILGICPYFITSLTCKCK